jgi:acetate kinase
MGTILVANAGSSSVKFQVYAAESSAQLTPLIRGQIDGVGTSPRLRATRNHGSAVVDRLLPTADVGDVPGALHAAGAFLGEQGVTPTAVGHRVVHGGPDYQRPVLVDSDVLRRLRDLVPLAPLHQPHNLAVIDALRRRFPDLPQVACFDTAFHRTHSSLADHYAIPARFYAEGVRRYGFHGLSYEYIANRLREIAPEIARKRVIVAHLGSGASMCALLDGRSVESTMGFTALDGLPMGTRSGQIDPGVLLYLLSEKGLSAEALQDMLYHDCGLKGLSGISNDVRQLASSPDPRASFAIAYFVYRIRLSAGMLSAALGGLDGFVFTAGIGENSAPIRSAVVEGLTWLGAALDRDANAANKTRISPPDSSVAVYAIPTDEELMIARHTVEVISENSTGAAAQEGDSDDT